MRPSLNCTAPRQIPERGQRTGSRVSALVTLAPASLELVLLFADKTRDASRRFLGVHLDRLVGQWRAFSLWPALWAAQASLSESAALPEPCRAADSDTQPQPQGDHQEVTLHIPCRGRSTGWSSGSLGKLVEPAQCGQGGAGRTAPWR